MVAARVAGTTAELTTEAANDNTQLSAIGQLSASLSSLQVGLAPLFNGTLQSTFAATASGSGLTATAAKGASAASYSVHVTQIAEAQSVSSGAFTSSQAEALGTGTLTIAVGDKSMSLNVTGSNNSLSAVASAINDSSSNPGISASVVTGSDGSHIILSATATGQDNTINVSVSNLQDDNGLSSFAVTSTEGTVTSASPSGASTITSGGSIAWSQSAAAQDAQFSLNGTSASSASNAVTTVLSGVTLNLSAAAVGTTQALMVSQDVTTQTTDIQTFVTDYNNVVSTMASLSSFNSSAAAGSQGGPLLGDTMLTTIQDALGDIAGGSVSSGGVRTSLSALGISLNPDGTLSVDTTTLTSAVQNTPTIVAALFNSTNGLGEQLNSKINAFTESGGVIGDRMSALTADLTSVTAQTTALTAYTAQLTSQYQAQFTALNSLMATTNNDSQYLTQLFGGTNSAGALATSAS